MGSVFNLGLSILLIVLIVCIIGFIIYKQKKSGNEGKRSIGKLIKYIALSITVTYFISGIFSVVGNGYISWVSGMDKQAFEEFLYETQEAEYYNNKEYTINEIEGCLKMVQYIEQHTNLADFANEEHSMENENLSQLAQDYMELYQIATTLAYDEQCSIKDIRNKFIKGEKNTVSEFYESKNYNKDTFADMLGLIDIGYSHNGIYFNDVRVYKAREILKESNISVDDEIQKIRSDDYEEISKYVDEHSMLGIKYPYSMDVVSYGIMNISQQIADLTYSIVIGIFIGVIIYAYSETREIRKLALIAICEIVLMAITEVFLLDEAGAINVRIGGMNAGFIGGNNLPVSATTIVAVVAISIFVVKVVLNKMQVKKLNDLKG